MVVTMFGCRKHGHKQGCCGFKSTEDLVKDFYFTRIQKELGEQGVECRYIDVDSSEAVAYPDVLMQVQQGTIKLPALMVQGRILLNGRFTSDQLLECIKKALGDAGTSRRQESEWPS